MKPEKIIPQLILIFHFVRAFFRPHADLALENLALRQQVATLKKDRPRPRLTRFDRLFGVLLRKVWPGWAESLIVVKPETVVGWHRKGFKLIWTYKSRKKGLGRPSIDKEIRELICRMARENITWMDMRGDGK